jgi:ABC-type Zn uptake system ZnuABC Zn-binding protein ZnuA
VVATTTQIGDWVRQVGGPQVSVDQVLQPNTDPHDYEPRPDDVAAAADARLAFANGDGLDGWIDEVVSDSGGDAEVVDLGAAVPLRLPAESGSEKHDPHWWSDPRDAEAAVRDIERRLAAADPAHRGLYMRNADAYLERVRALDRRLARCFDSIPPARRRLVTDHDAFGYFARRYGIEVAGAAIPSQATESQPSARDLRELAQTIEAEGVTAIFPESSLSPKVADAMARQTGARFGEALYGDALGPRGSSGATYLGMEQANADAMARGFTGGRRGCAQSR